MKTYLKSLMAVTITLLLISKSANTQNWKVGGNITLGNSQPIMSTPPGSGEPLIFATDGFLPANERMRITQTGLVGIGTPTPQADAHFHGLQSIFGSPFTRFQTTLTVFGNDIPVTRMTITDDGKVIVHDELVIKAKDSEEYYVLIVNKRGKLKAKKIKLDELEIETLMVEK